MRRGAFFFGREQELEELNGALADATAGRGRLFLLAGEAGIGKTRLASEVCERAAAAGFGVAWGRCWESGGAPAYWPWTQIVSELWREPDVGSELLPDPEAEALAVIAPDVASGATPRSRDAAPPPGDVDQAR